MGAVAVLGGIWEIVSCARSCLSGSAGRCRVLRREPEACRTVALGLAFNRGLGRWPYGHEMMTWIVPDTVPATRVTTRGSGTSFRDGLTWAGRRRRRWSRKWPIPGRLDETRAGIRRWVRAGVAAQLSRLQPGRSGAGGVPRATSQGAARILLESLETPGQGGLALTTREPAFAAAPAGPGLRGRLPACLWRAARVLVCLR